MARRSNFARIPKDLYRTFDPRAVSPLVPHLAVGTRFAEPCAGYGDLIDQLESHGMVCADAADISPRRRDLSPDGVVGYRSIRRAHALTARSVKLSRDIHAIITNPPWKRVWLHQMIDRFRSMRPTWLLFDAEWMHTRQSAKFMRFCSDVVSVGRVRWIPGTTMDGKDSCCWYRFQLTPVDTVFHGRIV